MADNETFYSPYPGILSKGDDSRYADSLLVSHANASVERNQDSQFAAARTQFVHRDVVAQNKENQVEIARNAMLIEQRNSVSDRNRDRQYADIKAELAVIRAEGLQRDITSLRSELAESKAEARNNQLMDVLNKVLAKLP